MEQRRTSPLNLYLKVAYLFAWCRFVIPTKLVAARAGSREPESRSVLKHTLSRKIE
jgi:hypothetical protein